MANQLMQTNNFDTYSIRRNHHRTIETTLTNLQPINQLACCNYNPQTQTQTTSNVKTTTNNNNKHNAHNDHVQLRRHRQQQQFHHQNMAPNNNNNNNNNNDNNNNAMNHNIGPTKIATTTTTTASANDGSPQNVSSDDFTPSPSPQINPFQYQRVIKCSPVASNSNKMSNLTKWLCAIIFGLVLVVLALVILDSPLRALRTSRANKFTVSRTSEEAGRLLAASSDSLDHFMYPGSSSAGTDHDQDHDPDQGHQEDSHDADNDISTPAPPTPTRFKQPGHGRHKKPAVSQRDPDATCMTPGCVRAAAQILNNMDNQTRPCDDFYQFACGRWIQTQVIPDEKTSLSVFSQNTADLNLKLRALIERPARPEDPPIVAEMRNMYASCMNLTDIEQRGDQPLLDVLRDLGGWPVLQQQQQAESTSASMSMATPPPPAQGRVRRRSDTRRAARAAGTSASTASPSWLETIIKFRQRGFSHDMIIDLSVVPDVRNSRRYIIELDQSTLGLPDRSYYFKGLNDTTVSAYYSLMVESAVMLGATRAEAQRQMTEALDFETSLAKISIPREQRRNITRLYNKMTARELYKLAPNIDWQRYLGALLKDDQLDMDQDEVLVKVPAFLRNLDTLLVSTEPRIVANYMIWRIVRHSMSGLSRRWRELAHGYSTVTTGRQVEESRWEQCLGSIDGTLGTALSAFYVKNHFNERSKAAALEMVDYIRAEFLRMLEDIDWMDEETRKEAKLKAQSIASYIGYPDELLNDELIEELYSGVKMSRQNFYQNVRNLRIWSTDYAFGQLRKPNKRGDWKKHARAAVVNAYYNSLENSIEFPAGILQGAFFDAERPNYMNFGGIGYVIGHEITHGFDDRGRQFDRDGNDRNWWKPKTDARFKERAQCIVEQYGNLTLPENGLKVNGLNTQGENIADNGGVKEAFRAYRRWTKDHGRELRLPGLDYSPDQLFWLSAANIWCGKFRPEVLKLRINSGVHSPARFRVIGPMSNSVEFAQSFNCPLGSPMNPRKKCSVW